MPNVLLQVHRAANSQNILNLSHSIDSITKRHVVIDITQLLNCCTVPYNNHPCFKYDTLPHWSILLKYAVTQAENLEICK